MNEDKDLFDYIELIISIMTLIFMIILVVINVARII